MVPEPPTIDLCSGATLVLIFVVVVFIVTGAMRDHTSDD